MEYTNKTFQVPYMINRDKLPNFKNACKNLDEGANEIYNICGIGNSINQGLFATNTQTRSFLGHLRFNLDNRYEPISDGFMPSFWSENGSYIVWTRTGNWTLVGGAGVANSYNESASQNDTATVQFIGTTFHVFTRTGANYGTFSVSIDGETTVNFDAGITEDNFHEFTIPELSDTTHTAVITNTDATKKLGLIGAYGLRGTKGFNVHMLGKGGSGIIAHAMQNPLGVLRHFSPVLTIISLIANDYPVQTSLVTYKTNMQTVINEALKYGDVLLTSIGLRKNTTYSIKQQEYVNVLYELADENEIAFLDYFGMMNAGLLGANMDFIKDEVHLSDLGHANAYYNLKRMLV